MGGSHEKMTILPITVDASVDPDALQRSLIGVYQRFHTFRADEAKCAVKAEREHLLAIIESGFGSLEAFDSLVSKLLSSVSRRSVAEQTEVVRRRSLRPNVVS